MSLLAPADANIVDGPVLGPTERAVLAVLVAHQGRVVDRATLRHAADLTDLGPRRCEAALVRLRAVFGADAILTVRRRGWMLSSDPAIAARVLPRGDPGL